MLDRRGMRDIFFFFSSGLHPWHMKVPSLGVKSELEPLATVTDTAMWDLSHICGLHHSPPQRRILNPLTEARN